MSLQIEKERERDRWRERRVSRNEKE